MFVKPSGYELYPNWKCLKKVVVRLFIKYVVVKIRSLFPEKIRESHRKYSPSLLLRNTFSGYEIIHFHMSVMSTDTVGVPVAF